MTDDELKLVDAAVQKGIEKYVNGHLRDIKAILKGQNDVSEQFRLVTKEHMARVEPVIKKFENDKIINEGAAILGKRAIFWAQIIGAIGVVAIAIRMGIIQLLTYKP